MDREQTGMKSVGMKTEGPDDIESSWEDGKLVWLFVLFATSMAITLTLWTSLVHAKQAPLPYATIDHPQFIPASQATFLSPRNLLIGVTDGKTVKAYPAAILAQHGVVQDQMKDGPIAVTW